jgi:hypothetical protein
MLFSRISGITASFVIAITQLAGQAKPPAGGTTTAPTGSPTRTPAPTATTSPTSTSTYPDDQKRPMMVSGKVVLDDGSAPPGPVTIERVCASGRPRAEGYTDSKGRFSITLGQEMSVIPDASESPNRSQMGALSNPAGGGVRERDLQTCDLRATVPGFRSEMISLSNRHYMDNPDVGTIVLHRLANVEGFTTSATLTMAPKDARKAYEKGLEDAKKNKPDDAQKDFQKAVDLYPKFAPAWYELGRVYEGRDHLDKARESYQQALTADAKYINPYERLYLLDGREAKWQEVADTTDKVMHLNPYDFPAAYYYNAVANLQLNKLDPAEKSAREAVKIDTAHENPRSNYILGIILAQKLDLKGAADCFRAYLQFAPNAKDADKVRQQLAELEKSSDAKAQPPKQN